MSGGENIASSEVERVLYEHEAVLEAAVVGRPDDRWGEVPVAFVVLRQAGEVTGRRAPRALPGPAGPLQGPQGVTFLDALPATRPARSSSGVRDGASERLDGPARPAEPTGGAQMYMPPLTPII